MTYKNLKNFQPKKEKTKKNIKPQQKDSTNESEYEARFVELVKNRAPELINGMVAQYNFFPGRDFASDFAWPENKLLVEIEGGIFKKSGCKYTHPLGYHNNCKKLNLAAERGFIVLRFTPLHFQKEEIIMLSNILKALGRWRDSGLRKYCLEKAKGDK